MSIIFVRNHISFALTFRRFACLLAAMFLGSSLACTALGQASPSPQISIEIRSASAATGEAAVRLSYPGTVEADSIHAILNGKDVTPRFTPVNCDSGWCADGTLLASDGIHAGKNVIYVSGKTTDGRLVTARQRFSAGDTLEGRVKAMAGYGKPMAAGPVVSYTPGFLPPTVMFQTLYTGGWDGKSPWFEVGTQQFPITAPCPSNAIYLILAFDRQTLAPYFTNGGGACAGNGPDLAAQLRSLPAGLLVVTGTLSNQASDPALDTSPIGGTNYTNAANKPTGYVAIGVSGATSGAYENFAVVTNGDAKLETPMWPFANGVVQEDSNGNYNYESSSVLEYWVDPFTKDPNADHPGMVRIGPSATQASLNPSIKEYRFLPPSLGGTSGGGYWLVVLRRDLPSSPVASATKACLGTPSLGSDGIYRYPNCGRIYFTGNSNSAISSPAYTALANDLNSIGPYDLAFLTVFTGNGYPVCCGTPWDFTGNSNWFNSTSRSTYADFHDALEALGGSTRATEFYNWDTGQYHPTPAYTFVFSRDTGDPLAGNSAVSASAYSAAGQTGYIHGLLAQNIHGLFQPFQTSQLQDSSADAASGPDYLISQLATAQPVAWPELSGTLMSGASSVAGQEAAYRYASYMLLTGHYIKGVSGAYTDDIHYFFTGSSVNYINYHYYDPASLPAPAFSGGQYCWAGPSSNPYPSPLCFTSQDFSTVLQQLSAEVTYLTNVMNFMVTGPVNMKNLVATGNANMGLALTSAAASILADNLTPATSTTQVKANLGNILQLAGGIVSFGADIAGFGALTEIAPLLKQVNFWGGALGTAAGATGAGVAGLKNTTTTTTGIPSRFISFTTTVGNLANSSLQNQMGIAFDATLDSFLADWGKLSALGPKITDTSTTYYSPNQAAQDAAIQVITKAAQRSFYMSLLPNFYGVEYFPGFFGINPNLDFSCPSGPCPYVVTNQPDMGSLANTGGGTSYCSPFFMQGSNSIPGVYNKAPALSFVWTPTPPYGGSVTKIPWASGVPNKWPYQYKTASPVDFYVVVTNPVSKPNTTQTTANFMPDSLMQQLFSSSGFNIPLDLFVGQYGPMQSTWANINTGSQSLSPLGWLPPQICNTRTYVISRNGADPVGSSLLGGTPTDPLVSTLTTITAPVSVVLNQSVTLKVSVTTDGSPMKTGKVHLLRDGTLVDTGKIDGTGSVLFVASGLSLGAHQFQALYAPGNDTHLPSESSIFTVMVYTADTADISLSLSTASVTARYGSLSLPVNVQVRSLSGLAGAVQFSCSGLPVNMACTFDPATADLASGGLAATSVKITTSTVKTAGFVVTHKLFALLASMSVLVLLRVRRGIAPSLVLAFAILLAMGATSGCAGTPPSSPAQEIGTKTILISATCGSLTRSTPLVVEIQ